METSDLKRQATRKLRLRPLHIAELPAHPTLQSIQSKRSRTVDLKCFVHEVLTEGVDFSDSVIPSNFQKRGSLKSSPPSTAKVQLLSCDLIQGESWFARQSVHENAPLEGTASWDEFEQGLYDDHSQHEMDYTPDVFDAHKVVDWSDAIEGLGDDFGGEFEDVSMESMRPYRSLSK